MADGDKPPVPHPFANMISAAQNGQINLRMDLEQFVYLDRDCQTFLDNIDQIQRIMDQVSQQETWGLGEHTHIGDGKELISGKTLVERFRAKSRGRDDNADNSVYAIMESHKQAVQDIQETYRAIRKRITDQDAEAAARYQQLEATLPKQPPVNPPPFFMANYA
ncbi:hypothetical protein [Nocardia terpenica]|uniref:PE domain-containing protein n=1 Tax=Nocardia terpenica TaxID=455432 RepID=A0A291RC82_9NOCA|nr:hypothetical protein [Nocardia terpenica]ATL65161.1 hypothetical protein CRH09_01845 [Nocardia terpenica]